MRETRIVRISPFLFSALLLASSTAALANETETSTEASTLGVGYKIGNGVGFTGVDILVSPIPHISLDLQVSWMGGFDTGIAVVPELQYSLDAEGSSPYLGIGGLYLYAEDGGITESGFGFVSNLGYEWKWDSGLGLQLGGGVSYIQEITVTNGISSTTIGGKYNPNLELGLRYRFL